ncbi:MAG: invasion associated locus B family protein [Alphaproteobacteria bacterium]|nr:invasion associated locus B family protein [Alphaproteobacteria bacterium]
MKPASTMIAAASVLLAAVNAGAETRLISKHADWDASLRTAGKERVCYISSLPKKSKGKYKTRGEVSVIVAHWPGRKRWAEVTVNAGYPFKAKSEVVIRIAGADHRLFTAGQQAYAYKGEDAKLVGAMRAGASMIIVGVSSKGTRTIDTYSLKGISAALKAIDAECRGKNGKSKARKSKAKKRKTAGKRRKK